LGVCNLISAENWLTIVEDIEELSVLCKPPARFQGATYHWAREGKKIKGKKR